VLYTIISIVPREKEQESLKSLHLFGLRVDLFSFKDLDFIPKNAHIITLNFEMLVEAQYDPRFKEIINKADLVIADGSFICFLILVLKGRVVEKIPGIELAERLIENHQKVALLGGKSKVIEVLKKKFQEKIVFSHHGYFEENSSAEEKIIREIKKSSPEIFLVALGSPKQEIFISQTRKSIDNSIEIGVGGAFDIWSGNLKRAPKWMQNFHLEWLFRIIQEPYRLKRLLYNVCRFFYLLLQ